MYVIVIFFIKFANIMTCYANNQYGHLDLSYKDCSEATMYEHNNIKAENIINIIYEDYHCMILIHTKIELYTIIRNTYIYRGLGHMNNINVPTKIDINSSKIIKFSTAG